MSVKIAAIKDQATKVAQIQDQLRVEREKLDELRRDLKRAVQEADEWVSNVINPGSPDEEDDDE